MTDYSAKKPRTVYDHIDLDLRGFEPEKKFHVKLGAHLPGEGDQLVALNADVGPIPEGDTTATPIDGHLSLKRVSLSGFSRFMNDTIPSNTDTIASGDADIRTEGALLSSKGNLRLENTTIRGNQLGYPIDAKYRSPCGSERRAVSRSNRAISSSARLRFPSRDRSTPRP